DSICDLLRRELLRVAAGLRALRIGDGGFLRGDRLRFLLHLLQTRAGAGDERGERGGVANREVSQHLAIDERAGGVQTGDELRIGDSVQAGGGVDARDPQTAEITFAIFAAGERGVQALLDLLLRDAVTARLHPVIALRELQDLDAAVLSFWTSFDSRHCFYSCGESF